nr:30S ribosomal protein S18 [Bacillus sp. WP8]
MPPPPTPPPAKPPKLSFFTSNPITHIHYKHLHLLTNFLSHPPKILPPPLTPTTPNYQPKFTLPIKTSPQIPLLPYLTPH